MDIFSLYITVFFFVFLVFPAIFFTLKLIVWCHTEYCKKPASSTRDDAQRTTIYTITADSRSADPSRNFTDFFWDVSTETSRTQNEIHKDDKDLPTYEEVMQMEMRNQPGGSTISPAVPPTAAVINVDTPPTVTTVSSV